MIKRIGTKEYNTETAKKIAEFNSSTHCTHEELYRKRTGEYFLYGEGGAMSHYRQYADGDDAWEGGQDITPLTYKQAKNWLKGAVNQDQDLNKIYEDEFGKSDKGDIESTHLHLSQKAKQKLYRLANEEGKTISKIMEELILNK